MEPKSNEMNKKIKDFRTRLMELNSFSDEETDWEYLMEYFNLLAKNSSDDKKKEIRQSISTDVRYLENSYIRLKEHYDTQDFYLRY